MTDSPFAFPASDQSTPVFIRAARLIRLLAHTRHIFLLPKAPDPSTKDHLSRWFETFLGILGIEVHIEGMVPTSSAFLIVANHISWLDIMVIRSLFSTCFIAKEEIRRWPVVGPIAHEVGTIFLDRSRLSSFRETLDASRRSLYQKIPLTVFPEGTTTNGNGLLPFKTGVFALCTETGRPALPVSIRYESPDGRQLTSVAYAGEDTLLRSFLRTIKEPRVIVRVYVSPHVDPEGKDRKALAVAAHNAVHTGLDLLFRKSPLR